MKTTGAQDEIRVLEERLLLLAVRRDAAELERLLSDDFVEFGSSGRVFDRAAVIESLAAERTEDSVLLEDFRVAMLAPTVALATYRAVTHATWGLRCSLRSSIWVNRSGRWQLSFHQGTTVADPEK